MTRHAKGLLLTAIGGVALSFDIPMIKLGGGDAWSAMAVRAGSAFIAALLIKQIAQWLTGRTITLLPGRIGVVIAALYGLTVVAFVIAVKNTSAANVAFIIAFTPAFTAMTAWTFLGERPSRATLLTIAVMVLAVGIIVSDGLQAGSLFGDACAMAAALLIAAVITLSRAAKADVGFAPMIGGIVPTVLGLAVLGSLGEPVRVDNAAWHVFNGMVLLPIAYWCLATGPRYISAPEVSMFYLLETVLAPVWVWLIFSEAPRPAVLIGGALLIGALGAHALWQLRVHGRRVQPSAKSP
ncbi:DMT family transporter [Oceaniradius stylonematis]|uniref:DMT family transporter n=1 Tax=Oceaniradius stylonematis TaxID=2184161 RepID=A0A3A8AF54_9HYPH|nr:DMT family transporter [Oceaniradius stylonematis]RKF06290.1 DMT family transporter [Oceaniradius stylonematis]